MRKIPDEEFGGNHHNGTGTYEARTPEQARQLYSELPRGHLLDQQRLEAQSRQSHPELWDKDPHNKKDQKGR
jgi:hypothetical protein